MNRITSCRVILGVLAAAGAALAQDANGGWRRIGDDQTQGSPQAPPPQVNNAPANNAPTNNAPLNNPPLNNPSGENQPPVSYQAAVPPQLTIPAGTFVTVRLNQVLSSDRNQQGDAFSATLARPLVVNGILVAQRGETVVGRVAEAKKAGRVEGTSRLVLELTELTLVDGQQVPIQSQLVTRNGRTSEGRDVASVAGTTAVGATIGAAADWGRGAAIGAGAGAAAGIIGVLLTRGQPTVVTPESLLTFRLTSPVTISTERAPQSFRYADPNEYNQPDQEPRLQTRAPAYGPPPPPYYSPYGYGYPYPYYGVGVYYGPRFYGPRVIVRGGRYRR